MFKYRMIVFLIAFLGILVIAGVMNVTSKDDVISGVDLIQNSSPIPTSNTATATQDSQVIKASDSKLEIVALCRGGYSILIGDECTQKFAEDNNFLGLGEPVTVMLTESGFPDNYEHRFDGAGRGQRGLDIDMQVASFVPGSTHSLQVRRISEQWSDPFVFKVDLLPPLENAIEILCIEETCSPPAVAFTKPVLVTDNYRYPFVEYINGVPLADQPFDWLNQSYLWAELMLDNNPDDIGCINCDVAMDAGILFPSRVRFMNSDIFYNWDLKHLGLGDHSLRVRLRNVKHTGPWSEEFKFRVVR